MIIKTGNYKIDDKSIKLIIKIFYLMGFDKNIDSKLVEILSIFVVYKLYLIYIANV